MIAKRYFETLKSLETDIERLVERISRLEALLDVCAQSYEHSRHSNDSADTLDRIFELDQLKGYFMNVLSDYVATLKQSEHIFSQFKNPQVKRVMSLYYVSNKPLKVIALEMNISKSKAHRLLEQGNNQYIEVSCD